MLLCLVWLCAVPIKSICSFVHLAGNTRLLQSSALITVNPRIKNQCAPFPASASITHFTLCCSSVTSFDNWLYCHPSDYSKCNMIFRLHLLYLLKWVWFYSLVVVLMIHYQLGRQLGGGKLHVRLKLLITQILLVVSKFEQRQYVK